MKKKILMRQKLKSLIKKKSLLFPLVVKPTNEGSSIGVKICNNIKILTPILEPSLVGLND